MLSGLRVISENSINTEKGISSVTLAVIYFTSIEVLKIRIEVSAYQLSALQPRALRVIATGATGLD